MNRANTVVNGRCFGYCDKDNEIENLRTDFVSDRNFNGNLRSGFKDVSSNDNASFNDNVSLVVNTSYDNNYNASYKNNYNTRYKNKFIKVLVLMLKLAIVLMIKLVLVLVIKLGVVMMIMVVMVAVIKYNNDKANYNKSPNEHLSEHLIEDRIYR